MMTNADLSLHKAVFSGDIKTVEQLLKKANEEVVNRQDIHGNTALHIAVMKGNKQCIDLLLKSGANTTIRNELNWLAIHEAISLGDIQIAKSLNDALSRQMVKYLKKEYILKVVDDIKQDFSMKFEVRIKDFNANTVIGPPEVRVSLVKKGRKIKADLEITDCFHSRPESFHLIFDLNPNNNSFIKITVGEDIPFYQIITFEDWEGILTEVFRRESLDTELRSLMQKENITYIIEKNLKSTQKPLFRKTITKKVGNYKTDVYETQDLEFTTKTRSEHMLARNQNSGNTEQTIGTLPAPEPRNVNWEEYISAPKGKFPSLGRQSIEISDTKKVSVVIGLTNEIPLDWKWIIALAEQVFSHKLVSLITLLTKELPNGFPVVIDFPIKPTIQLKWKLNYFEIVSDLDESVFNIPEHFQERVIFRIERNDGSNT